MNNFLSQVRRVRTIATINWWQAIFWLNSKGALGRFIRVSTRLGIVFLMLIASGKLEEIWNSYWESYWEFIRDPIGWVTNMVF